MTWNVAAVNNNPFEYWISYDDPLYLELMQGVECFLDDPQGDDVEVSTIFTESMFQELMALCAQEGMPGLSEVENMWCGDEEGSLHLSKRRIVTEFIKDKTLGSKRLISMPDRMTNTINVVTQKESTYQPPPACRPCVINNYEGDLSTKEVWWQDWKKFMFVDTFTVRTRVGTLNQRPVDMLEPIPCSKYPAVTEAEERVAIPLQLLCLAIFDSVIVHFMNKLSPAGHWQIVKAKICERLYRSKNYMTMNIIATKYKAVDVICLQEAAAVFKDTFQDSPCSATHELVLPTKLDGKRDQNSVVMLKKDSFRSHSITEVTGIVVACVQDKVKFADGDLLAVVVEGARDGRQYLIVSFHGDSNGMLTAPMVRAVHAAVGEKFQHHIVMLAVDANVFEEATQERKLFTDFIAEVTAMGFSTCFGDSPDVRKIRTTCSARTSLQPQLNKAIRNADKIQKADKNPKDLIMFYSNQVRLVPSVNMGKDRQPNPMKDNTGSLYYREDSIFPTLDFPSDHGIVAAALQVMAPPAGR